jgi:transcriptional regulator with XRE-family HTH domain
MTLTTIHDLMAHKILDAAKLVLLREQRGWRIADVVWHAAAKGLRISRQTVANLESGESDGTVRSLSILAAVYEIDDLDSLFKIVE